MSRIDEIIAGIERLPAMNEVVVRLLELLNDPEVDLREVVEVINLDQGLTGNVLRLCNSAYFGLPRQVESIANAAVMLGINTLYEVVINSIAGFYLATEKLGYGLEKGELWRFSIGSALGSQILARKLGMEEFSNKLYTLALMQDLGKIVIDKFLVEEGHRIQELVSKYDYSFSAAEEEVLGWDHARVGGQILSIWNFPEDMVEAVIHHHHPEKNELSRTYSEIIYLSNLLVMSLGIGLGLDGLAYRLNATLLKKYNLTQEDLQTLSISLLDRIQAAEELIQANQEGVDHGV